MTALMDIMQDYF